MKKKQKALLIIIFILFIFLQSIPFLFGYLFQGGTKIFSGYIFQWTDVTTYIGKMKQGYDGAWLFKLDYVQNPGKGVFIYPFYILLGHLSRILNIKLIYTFHIAKIFFSTLMFFSLYRFIQTIFKEKSKLTQTIIFSAVLAGNGISWLSIFFSEKLMTTIEAFPQTISNISPHFALMLALLFIILTPYPEKTLTIKNYIFYSLATIMLALISPFSIVIVISIFTSKLIYKLLLKQNIKESFIFLIVIGNSGGWLILYQYYIISTHPVLIYWKQQNIISDISVFNFFLSFLPYSIFFIFALIRFIKNRNQIAEHKLIIYLWGLLIPIFLFIPYSLNTRFITGAFVPIATTSIDYLSEIIKKKMLIEKLKAYAYYLATIFLIFETIILILIADGYRKRDNVNIYIPNDVIEAFSWIDNNLPDNSYIFTGEFSGNHLPIYTSSIPTLGHWCETPNASKMFILSKNYYVGKIDNRVLLKLNIDYIFYGPNEARIGTTFDTTDLIIIYQNPSVTLYQLPH